MPLFRKERSDTFSSALTKACGSKHDLRLGVDIVRDALNHRRAEFGEYGLGGGFSFSGLTTGTPGYTPLLWNQFAGFLLGLPSFLSKDVQTEEMTGREWQSAVYLRDKWNVNEKLTVSAGLRAEYYPLMRRAGRGLQTPGHHTYTLLIRGHASP